MAGAFVGIFGGSLIIVGVGRQVVQSAQTLATHFEFLGVDSSFAPPEASVFEQEYTDKIDDRLRSRLIETFYSDIKELERLLGRDLSGWYEKRQGSGGSPNRHGD